jgi:hypothetical protein
MKRHAKKTHRVRKMRGGESPVGEPYATGNLVLPQGVAFRGMTHTGGDSPFYGVKPVHAMQQGGMAPYPGSDRFDAGLAQAAGTASLDMALKEVAGLRDPNQMGGRKRKSRKSAKKTHRKSKKSHRKSRKTQRKSKKSHRKSRKTQRKSKKSHRKSKKSQRGGADMLRFADIPADYVTRFRSGRAYAADPDNINVLEIWSKVFYAYPQDVQNGYAEPDLALNTGVTRDDLTAAEQADRQFVENRIKGTSSSSSLTTVPVGSFSFASLKKRKNRKQQGGEMELAESYKGGIIDGDLLQKAGLHPSWKSVEGGNMF